MSIGLITASHEIQVPLATILVPLQKRLKNTEWLTVLKGLLVIHRLIREASPRLVLDMVQYYQYLNVDHFMDAKTEHSRHQSMFCRSYATYIEKKLYIYGKIRTEFEKNPQKFSEIGVAKLLSTLPVVVEQLEVLLRCRKFTRHVDNVVTYRAFANLLQDSTKLFNALNQGLLILMDHFFTMAYEPALACVQLYKDFCGLAAGMDGLYQDCKFFLPDLPEITHAPTTLLPTLEEHVDAVQASGEGQSYPVRKDSRSRSRDPAERQSVSKEASYQDPLEEEDAPRQRDQSRGLSLYNEEAAALGFRSALLTGGETASVGVVRRPGQRRRTRRSAGSSEPRILNAASDPRSLNAPVSKDPVEDLLSLDGPAPVFSMVSSPPPTNMAPSPVAPVSGSAVDLFGSSPVSSEQPASIQDSLDWLSSPAPSHTQSTPALPMSFVENAQPSVTSPREDDPFSTTATQGFSSHKEEILRVAHAAAHPPIAPLQPSTSPINPFGTTSAMPAAGPSMPSLPTMMAMSNNPFSMPVANVGQSTQPFPVAAKPVSAARLKTSTAKKEEDPFAWIANE